MKCYLIENFLQMTEQLLPLPEKSGNFKEYILGMLIPESKKPIL
jgi:hypothetical protein